MFEGAQVSLSLSYRGHLRKSAQLGFCDRHHNQTAAGFQSRQPQTCRELKTTGWPHARRKPSVKVCCSLVRASSPRLVVSRGQSLTISRRVSHTRSLIRDGEGGAAPTLH